MADIPYVLAGEGSCSVLETLVVAMFSAWVTPTFDELVPPVSLDLSGVAGMSDMLNWMELDEKLDELR